MNTTANIIQEDKQALVVECGTKRLYVQHAGKGDIRLAVADLVDRLLSAMPIEDVRKFIVANV